MPITTGLLVMLSGGIAAQNDAAPRIVLAPGVTIVQTLHTPVGERESLITVADEARPGMRFVWRFIEVHTNGDTIRAVSERFVSAADLAAAPRLRTYHEEGEPLEHPGYTTWMLSTAIYEQVRRTGMVPYSILQPESSGSPSDLLAGFGFASRPVITRWRGSLHRIGAGPENFPLLVNGRRVTVPALHLRGEFTAREIRWNPDIWVLADSANPLLLKATKDRNVLQTVRIDFPIDAIADRGGFAGRDGSGHPNPAALGGVERTLASACRLELPGTYFAFNSAALDPASDRALASLSAVLSRHPDWAVTIEGHTDSIGSAAANQVLSERRAAAVRERLTARHGIPAARLRSVGYGASTPREPNETIEGRARNRRVELVRPCATRP